MRVESRGVVMSGRPLALLLAAALLVACNDDSGAGTQRHKPDEADSGTAKTITGTASVNGAELYYEERGTGSAVVLLHGFTLDTRMWDSQFASLSGSHRVIRFDMRGHGQSSGAGPVNGEALSFSQSEDVLGLLDFLEVDKAHIVGLSMGGYVAYEFVIDHPDRTLSLAVLDSAWRYDTANTGAFQPRLIGYLGLVATDGLEAGLRAWAADPLFAPLEKLPKVKAAVEDIVLVGHLAQGTGAFFANPGSAKAPSPLSETRLGEIGVPSLVLVGELDDPEFRAHADELADGIPGAEKVVIAGSGHMSTMEKPEEVDKALGSFLAKH